MNWESLTHFAGLDWAKDHHDLVVIDASGAIVLQHRFNHDPEGWNSLREKLTAFPKLGVALETSSGSVIEQLLELDLPVFPVNPKAASRFRDRLKPSGVKTDFFDAWTLADALRMDGRHFKQLRERDPLTEELRQLCRDEQGLIATRTSLVNQLHRALSYYYPQIALAFDLLQPQAWAFVESFPTPADVHRAGKRKLQKWMHAHKLWFAEKTEKRLEQLLAPGLEAKEATVRAKSLLASSVARMLRVLQAQIDEYRKRIEALYAKHPDHDLFGSLPGAGEKIAPRLIAELGADRSRFDDAQALQCYAGTAPAFFQSGQIQRVYVRRGCNQFLRNAIHHLADKSRRTTPWAQAYYQAHRKKGKTHACALRCLGQRWIKILYKMWVTRTPYDPELHQRNQLKHGSWLVSFQPA